MMREKVPVFSAVIFDMDGVIFDTEKLVLQCWQEVADKYHIPDIKAACTECLGLNQEATVEKFLQRYGKDFPYAEYKAEMRDLFFGPMYGEHLPIKPGVEELLQGLKENHIPTALATSTRTEMVLKELEDAGLRSYFDKIVCGDMVAHSKPHPEIFVRACEELQVRPCEAFAVEDSFNGIRAAHAGGLMPVMVPDMLEPTPEILELVHAVFPSLKELKQYLL